MGPGTPYAIVLAILLPSQKPLKDLNSCGLDSSQHLFVVSFSPQSTVFLRDGPSLNLSRGSLVYEYDCLCIELSNRLKTYYAVAVSPLTDYLNFGGRYSPATIPFSRERERRAVLMQRLVIFYSPNFHNSDRHAVLVPLFVVYNFQSH